MTWRRASELLGIALLGLALAAWIAACSPSVEEAARIGRFSRDYVAIESGVTSSGAALEAEEVHCKDETFLAWTLSGGEELELVVDLTRESSLIVSGCSPSPATAAARFTIETSNLEGVSTLEAELEGQLDGWWSRELDLSSLADSQTRLKLRVGVPDGERVYLSELLIEQNDALPAPMSEPVPQILLISVDTLREDAISELGGTGQTPALDRLVRESEVFSPHYSAAAWTKPSHASLLTGHYSEVHGAGINPETRIREGLTSLAERFRRGGFLTAGLVFDCVWLDPEFGFARGFDVYSVLKGRARRMGREAGNWMARHRDRPFFFFLHTYEVHSDFHALPYESPGVSRETVRDRFGVANYGCRESSCASGLLAKLKDGELEPIEKEEEILRYLYGESVSYLDGELGRLFDRLRELDMWDGMTVVLTSDHGEQFFEHGGVEHGSYWEEVLRVPLVIKWPGGRLGGERRDLTSSAIDIAPTLLAAYDLEIDDLPGSALAERRPDEPVFAGDLWRMIRIGDAKAIYDYHEKRRLLFDLGEDPMETTDLSAERIEELERLSAIFMRHQERMKRWVPKEQEPGSRELSKEDEERLKSLGYLGGNG